MKKDVKQQQQLLQKKIQRKSYEAGDLRAILRQVAAAAEVTVEIEEEEEGDAHVHALIQEGIDQGVEVEVEIGVESLIVDHVVKMVNAIQRILKMRGKLRKVVIIFNGNEKRRREREMIMKVHEFITNERDI